MILLVFTIWCNQSSKQLVTFKDFIKYLGAIKICPSKKERGEDDLNVQRQDLMAF